MLFLVPLPGSGTFYSITVLASHEWVGDTRLYTIISKSVFSYDAFGKHLLSLKGFVRMNFTIILALRCFWVPYHLVAYCILSFQ